MTDARARGLSVDWTKGAIFEFASRREAEAWADAETRGVPGRFFLAEPSDRDHAVPVDYYLKYTGGKR